MSISRISRETFLHFDKRCKQKIMADLVNMISMGESGKTERRQTGLKTLSYLVDEALDEMSQFSLYMSK